jgi:TonB family protein
MIESVTDVIVSRSQRQERLGLTFVSSAFAHAAVLAIFVLMPRTSANEPPREVMKISLGGSVGPRTGGLTQIGGREVQEVAPPKPQPRVAPPAPAQPKMTLPTPKPRPAPKPARTTEEVPPSRTVATGAEVTEGSTPVDTGARGKGWGISSAGGAGGGVTLDVSDFCCPAYLELMIANIHRNWQQEQGRPGSSVIRFTIHRDGSIDIGNVTIDKPSGFLALDLAARRAVQQATLPPLPAAFPNQTLTVYMKFLYER